MGIFGICNWLPEDVLVQSFNFSKNTSLAQYLQLCVCVCELVVEHLPEDAKSAKRYSLHM